MISCPASRSSVDVKLSSELELLLQKGYNQNPELMGKSTLSRTWSEGEEGTKGKIWRFWSPKWVSKKTMRTQSIQNCRLRTKLHFSKVGEMVKNYIPDARNKKLSQIVWAGWDWFSNSPLWISFSFNNPFGACKTCEGFGNVLGIGSRFGDSTMELSSNEGR